MGIARKKEIYDICVEYGQIRQPQRDHVLIVFQTDIIIIEDDPYFFLQEGPYIPKSERVAQISRSTNDDEAAYVSSLAPSFLKYLRTPLA
jgi:aromatic amino acid aminotransferase I